MPDPKLIAEGGKVAYAIHQAMTDGGIVGADRARSQLSEADIRALAAFRDHQLATLVAQVEDSPQGAEIRWQAALRAYDAHVSNVLATTISGAKK
ncbi:hypothetical protein [Sphingobium fuliginis]|uniref:Uncharacterized protein n=1 Tax=Sphingobium fuliginis (strain ATCC 27551) TaxID=336203 RepID=A0ABQ1ET65_SPHSA|nr:hypothetical protein [Sphingobium fuliginis]RYL99493.1 hypothetical protein EWH10_06360 [Sphingobium fuliginis]GFZ85141.1 hypothetical protein GCM10019071_12700 [Sphingobium fuliginis]